MLDLQTYLLERAICDKAEAYRAGRTMLTAIEAAHPDYAACTNDMRGRVEEYELNRDKPAAFSAYAVDDNARTIITTWTGNKLGEVTYSGRVNRNNFGARWRSIHVRTVWGQNYFGRWYFDAQQCVSLRRAKA